MATKKKLLHSPAPWTWKGEWEDLTLVDAEDHPVIEVHRWDYGESSALSCSETDQPIIAAAPLLLEALIDLLQLAEEYEEQIEGEWGSGRSLAAIEAAGHLAPAFLKARVAIEAARSHA